MLGKAMQAQSQLVTASAGEDFKGLSIGADKLYADLFLWRWLGTHDG